MDPVTCPHCGRLVEPRERACPHCGIDRNPYATWGNPVARAEQAGLLLRRMKARGGVLRLVAVAAAVVVLLGIAVFALASLLR